MTRDPYNTQWLFDDTQWTDGAWYDSGIWGAATGAQSKDGTMSETGWGDTGTGFGANYNTYYSPNNTTGGGTWYGSPWGGSPASPASPASPYTMASPYTTPGGGTTTQLPTGAMSPEGFPSPLPAGAMSPEGFPSPLPAGAMDPQGFPSPLPAGALDPQGFPSPLPPGAMDPQGFPSPASVPRRGRSPGGMPGANPSAGGKPGGGQQGGQQQQQQQQRRQQQQQQKPRPVLVRQGLPVQRRLTPVQQAQQQAQQQARIATGTGFMPPALRQPGAAGTVFSQGIPAGGFYDTGSPGVMQNMGPAAGGAVANALSNPFLIGAGVLLLAMLARKRAA